MSNVLQMKELFFFTTTISHSLFAVFWENTTEAKHTHQVIVLDSITSSAKLSVFRKQSLSSYLDSLSKTIQQQIQNSTTYLYSTNTVHASSNKFSSKWFNASKWSPTFFLFCFCFYIKCLESYTFNIRFKTKQNNALNNSALQRDGQVLNPQLFEILCVQ